MKLKLYTFIALIFSTILLSCKTASKLYQKGDYDEAVQLAAKKLQKDPNDAKLLDLIQNSYRYAVADHESRIRSNSESSNELKWEWTYNEYVALQRMYDAIYKVPQVNEIVHPQDYSSYLVTYSEKASDVRYNRGLSLMDNGDKRSFRQAYSEFQIAANLKPGDRAINDKMNEAFENAVVNVVVLPVEQSSFRYSSYNYGINSMDNNILRSLQNNTGNQFIRFFSSWDARAQNIRADEVVDLQFSSMNIGHYFDSRNKRQVSKDVVTREIVYRPDSVVKEYSKVYADITTTTRTMRSEGILHISIRDGDGGWLWNNDIRGEHNWTTQLYTYTGDARALTDADKQLVNRQQEQVSAQDEIMRCIMNEIENNLVCQLRDHYSRL
jgi:hypothetical protein